MRSLDSDRIFIGFNQVPEASLPQGQLLYAIGDIHGRADLLTRLLGMIEADAAACPEGIRKTLIFLGDYVDRGPDSRRVVEILLGQLPSGIEAHFLKGNHEAILLDFLSDPLRLGHWLANGGEATMRSYGVDTGRLQRGFAEAETWRQAFAARLPDAHRRFFETLELARSVGDYFFVHAGVRPKRALDAQEPEDLLWIRGLFLEWEEPFAKVVVHGHTPVSAPEIRSNRIGIDTGAVFTGRLTALRLEGSSRRFLQT